LNATLSAGEIFYRKGGAGEVVVFLPNGGGDHRTWEKFTAKLEGFSWYALDLFGWGQSSRPATPYDLSFYRKMLDEFFVQEKISSAILVGNCVGASIAWDFASHYPQRVQGLFLFHPYLGEYSMPSLQLVKRGWISPALAAWFISLPIFRSEYFLWARAPDRDDPLWRHQQEMERHPLLSHSRKFMIAGAPSFAEILGQTPKVPLQVFWGEKNRAVADLARKKIAALGVPVAVLPGAGHLAIYEDFSLIQPHWLSFTRSLA
jgi:pimeloyl-ACP methyl ester carboxylesterase